MPVELDVTILSQLYRRALEAMTAPDTQSHPSTSSTHLPIQCPVVAAPLGRDKLQTGDLPFQDRTVAYANTISHHVVRCRSPLALLIL